MKSNKKSKTTSFRLDSDLKKPINEWLMKHTAFTLSSLLNFALRKVISEKQILEPVLTVKAKNEKIEKIAKKMIKKHADMLEKLK